MSREENETAGAWEEGPRGVPRRRTPRPHGGTRSCRRDRGLGLFGSSTGAAAALRAAAQVPRRVGAVVSRGGRPDLAEEALPEVASPTLLIVGGKDTRVIEMNREARSQMNAETELEIVEGAGHLFEEEGKLDEVADLAADWFREHLAPVE